MTKEAAGYDKNSYLYKRKRKLALTTVVIACAHNMPQQSRKSKQRMMADAPTCPILADQPVSNIHWSISLHVIYKLNNLSTMLLQHTDVSLIFGEHERPK